MRILFIGDVFGRPGRRAVSQLLPGLKAREGIDFTVVNAENASHGAGLVPSAAEELFRAGADVLTLGNHTWDRPEVEVLLKGDRVLRPANYPPGPSGRGHGLFQVKGRTVAVLQLMGRHHMAAIDCPFRAADDLLGRLKADAVLVDMHAEATSEKQAMGWHLDGRVSAVVGSHTHVQTADERILPGGTAYLTDAGMTGPRDGVIGAQKEPAIRRFLSGMKVRYEPADGDAQFCACLVDVDEATGKAESIRRIFEVVPARG